MNIDVVYKILIPCGSLHVIVLAISIGSSDAGRRGTRKIGDRSTRPPPPPLPNMASSSIPLPYYSRLLIPFVAANCFLILVACPSSTSALTSTASQFLDGHNAARKAVGVPPLRWDGRLTTYARVYANQRRRDCQLVHSPGYAYGENIFWGQGRRWRVPAIVAAWVDEKRWYRYDNNTCAAEDCTHYTQIVWRTTERVGCAKIICDDGDTFAVCEYYPPGNYVGARPY